jgi:AAA+ superfamily predicted ATPase
MQVLKAYAKVLSALIRHRIQTLTETSDQDDYIIAVPVDMEQDDPFLDFIRAHSLSTHEQLLLFIALIPHLQPDFYDTEIQQHLPGKGDFPQIGGTRSKQSRGFLPTGETALFLLGGNNWDVRMEVAQIFWPDHFFSRTKVLWLEEMPSGEPTMSGRLLLSQDHINIFTHGKPVPPHFSSSFPAKQVQTELAWEDLVINNDLRSQIDELMNWVNYNAQLMNKWKMEKRLRKGYRALFYGPPGTGKTFTAGLLGKYTGKEVYKIDLSMIVSKYIGETEKNLELLFSRAEDKGWILFFDEADALFGKRTNVRDAHDKYANQEVSYLLQRIEDYNGLIILATNMKNNIDDAFIRRFNAILKFSFPDANERAMIWRRTFPQQSVFIGGDAPEMVKRFELAGGSILNVVHYACLKAIEKHTDDKEKLEIHVNDVLDGIKREFVKEGKPF